MARIELYERFLKEYEEWFNKNHFVFYSEIQIVNEQSPECGEELKICVGTGRFSSQRGIRFRVEPSLHNICGKMHYNGYGHGSFVVISAERRGYGSVTEIL